MLTVEFDSAVSCAHPSVIYIKKYLQKQTKVSNFSYTVEICRILFSDTEELDTGGVLRSAEQSVNLSKKKVDVALTSCQRHVNVCKSILDVNAS